MYSNTPQKAKAAAGSKRGRRTSVVDEESSDESEAESTTTSRKRKASSKVNGSAPRKKASTARVPKTKTKRAARAGMNAIADRFDPFPLHSAFDFDIPALESPEQSSHTAFVFGNGDFGQHGMGYDEDSDADSDDDKPKKPKVLVEIARPRLHILFEEMIGKKEKGWEKGIATLECGGMHTLAVDGEGRVWSWG